MSESILAFQSQLSGVMETVFKAAMYEIVRLVEESFVEEVSRSREQVESLKKRLQWSESRRREREADGRSRCAECGRSGAERERAEDGLPGAEGDSFPGAMDGHGLKQEGPQEGKWNSCPRESADPPSVQITEEEAMPSTIKDPQVTPITRCRKELELKEESSEQHQDTGAAALQDVDEADNVRVQMRRCKQVHGSTMRQDSWLSSAHVTEHERSRLEVGETSQRYTPQPERERLSVELLSHAEGHTHRAVTQFRTAPTREGGSPQDSVAQMKTQPVGESVSPSRSTEVECELEDSVAVKQEDAVPVDCTVAARLDVAHAQRERSRDGRPGAETQSGEALNLPLTLDLTGLPGTCSQLEHVSLHRQQQQPFMGKHLQVILRDNSEASDIDSPVEGGSLSYGKYFIMPKDTEAQHKVCSVDKQFSSIHVEKDVTHAVLTVKPQLKSPHSCTQCGKSFSHSCHLKAHLQTHTGERPFICTLCGRSFTKLSNLKAHRRVHTGERPYICTDCGKRFTQKCNLKRHQRIHTERLFVCK